MSSQEQLYARCFQWVLPPPIIWMHCLRLGLTRCGAAAVLAHLDAHCQRWDVCDLQQLRPTSALLRVAVPGGWQEERTVQDTCPVLALPATVEAWHGCLSQRLRKNLRYAWRRFAQLGAVSVARAAQGKLH